MKLFCIFNRACLQQRLWVALMFRAGIRDASRNQANLFAQISHKFYF